MLAGVVSSMPAFLNFIDNRDPMFFIEMVFYQAGNHELSDYLEPVDGEQFLSPTTRSLKNASPLHFQLYIIDYHSITNE